jgi:hypothetical protein
MLLPLFESLEASAIGEFIRTSQWLFPAIECVHLLGLVMLGAAVLLVDLRLVGVLLPRQPVREVGDSGHRLLLWGVAVMIATGVPLFLSEAIKCYYSQAFWVKITTLVPALLFALTVRRRVAASGEGERSRATLALTGAVSMALWFTVAAAGRWIGFS